MPRLYPRPEQLTNYTPVLRPMPLPDEMDIDTWQSVCVVLPKPFIPYLLGVMEIYRWQDRVQGTEADRKAFVGAWVALMAHIAEATDCEDGYMFKLRQNPENDCQLQQSWDGGASWTLAYDYSLCTPPQPKAIRNILIQQFITEINTLIDFTENVFNTWDNDITNIYTTLIYGNSDDLFRDFALCAMISRLVDAVCDFIVFAIQQKQANQLTALKAFEELSGLGGITKFLAEGVFKTQLAISAAALEAESALLTIWVNTVSEDVLAIYQDAAARADVACCWYNGMKGFTPTVSRFQSSLDACILTGNALTIRNRIDEMIVPVTEVTDDLKPEKMYFIFADLWRESLDYAKNGYITEDDCPCNTWEQEFDFTISNGGWVNRMNGISSGTPGSHSSGTGWVHGLYKTGDFPNRGINGISIKREGFSPSTATVTNARIEFVKTTGTYSNTGALDFGVVMGAFFSTNSIANTSGLWEIGFNQTVSGELYLAMICGVNTNNNPNSPGGTLTINKITLSGTGTNPFI